MRSCWNAKGKNACRSWVQQITEGDKVKSWRDRLWMGQGCFIHLRNEGHGDGRWEFFFYCFLLYQWSVRWGHQTKVVVWQKKSRYKIVVSKSGEGKLTKEMVGLSESIGCPFECAIKNSSWYYKQSCDIVSLQPFLVTAMEVERGKSWRIIARKWLCCWTVDSVLCRQRWKRSWEHSCMGKSWLEASMNQLF